MALPESHTDLIGQPVYLDSYVIAPRRNSLEVCKVIKVTNLMLRVEPLKSKNDFLVYPKDAVVLSGPDALAYLLKYA